MRISEKTLELSVIAQFTQRLGVPNAIWLGLTQAQEKKFGFDAASLIDGSLYILQFKASNSITGPASRLPGHRKFKLPHAQLSRLQAVSALFPGTVSYVFPDIGTTDELQLNNDLVAQTWLLPVDQLEYPYPAPTGPNHYAYIAPPHCELRSEPKQAKLLPLLDLAREVSVIRKASATALDDRLGKAARMAAVLRQPEFTLKGRRVYGLLIPA